MQRVWVLLPDVSDIVAFGFSVRTALPVIFVVPPRLVP
jgi:hypothetical protein